jgi:hypothetical protein
MDEIYHYILASDLKREGIPENKVVNFARDRVPANSVMRVIEIMERSGLLEKSDGLNPNTRQVHWRAVVKSQD